MANRPATRQWSRCPLQHQHTGRGDAHRGQLVGPLAVDTLTARRAQAKFCMPAQLTALAAGGHAGGRADTASAGLAGRALRRQGPAQSRVGPAHFGSLVVTPAVDDTGGIDRPRALTTSGSTGAEQLGQRSTGVDSESPGHPPVARRPTARSAPGLPGGRESRTSDRLSMTTLRSARQDWELPPAPGPADAPTTQRASRRDRVSHRVAR